MTLQMRGSPSEYLCHGAQITALAATTAYIGARIHPQTTMEDLQPTIAKVALSAIGVSAAMRFFRPSQRSEKSASLQQPKASTIIALGAFTGVTAFLYSKSRKQGS